MAVRLQRAKTKEKWVCGKHDDGSVLKILSLGCLCHPNGEGDFDIYLWILVARIVLEFWEASANGKMQWEFIAGG